MPQLNGSHLSRYLQIQYRLGNNKEAIALYSQLFRSHSADGREVQTNVLAAYVAGGRADEVPAVMEAMKASLACNVLLAPLLAVPPLPLPHVVL